MVFGWLAITHAVVNWIFVFAGELEVAVEVGGCSLFALAAGAVGCAMVAMIIVACHHATLRGFKQAIIAIMLAVVALVGFFGPLILLFSRMRMF